ncbi:MAG: glycoside hydrolase family 2 protein, partial [Fibrobacterota bacterium]
MKKLKARKELDFNRGWKFLRGDVINSHKEEYLSDHFWRELDLPHDWSIEGPFRKDNASTMRGGYLPTGIGWYRKTFALDKSDEQKQFFVDFDGIFGISDVYVNGRHCGYNPNTFQGFQYDITRHLYFGDKLNVMAVRVDNSVQPACRYYSGCGICRDVRLIICGRPHIAQWGIFVRPENVNPRKRTAQVHIETEIIDELPEGRQITVSHTVLFNGKTVTDFVQKIDLAGNKPQKHSCTIPLTDAKLWDTKSPHLYKLYTGIKSGNTLIDDKITTFGVRKIEFTHDKGFLLNDRQLKLKGVCIHHDNGCLGSAAYKRADERK